LSTRITFVGRAGYGYLFYIGFWRWRVDPTLFFLNWNLFPSNIIPHK
jgi:hypothetical protein